MEEGDKNQTNAPPDPESEADFPPLPKQKRPKALAVETISSKVKSSIKASKLVGHETNMKNKMQQKDSIGTNQALSPTKRKIGTIKRLNEDEAKESNAAQSLCGAVLYPNTSSELGTMSPVKRTKLMNYREPAVLKSLDSDTFKSLACLSSSAGESFLSEGEQSTPTISPSTSTPMYENNNLGSLSEFIQQYSGTTLNSLPIDFDSPTCEVSGSISGAKIASPLALPKLSSPDTSQETLSVNTALSAEDCNKNPNGLGGSQCLTPSLTEAQQTKEKVTSKSSKNLRLILETPCSSKHKPKTPKKLKDVVDGNQYICGCAEDQSLTPVVGLYEAGHPKDITNRACKKNPGHPDFHLPSELKVKDLPPDIQHEDSVTFFNCLSQLVVRITVERTSDKRSPDDMYSNYIGTKSRRNGSGFIGHVDERLMKIKCKREDCCGTDDPDTRFNSSSSLEDSLMSPPVVDRSFSNISTASSTSSNSSTDSCGSHYYYGGVYINTNKHVIFDKLEADHAHVHFFYNTPDKKGVIHGHVASIIGVSPNQDRVTLHVMSHDRNLFNLINLHLKNASSSYKQMVQSTHTLQQVHAYGKKHSWAVIISHAHGLAKSITCGRVRSETLEAKCVVKYYDAATCPGSSGGLVTTPSLLHLQWPGAVHSCCDATTGLNVTFDSRFPDLDSKFISRIHKPLLGRKESLPDNIFSL